MAPDDLIAKLIDAGALDAGQAWTARPLGGGLNTRVYHLRSEQDPRGYIARLRERGSFASEAEMLAAAAGCPGVPEIVFADDHTLAHRYLDGRPRPLNEAGPGDLARLMAALTCLHGRTFPAYTPWPERQRVPGTLAGLFRFRVRSLEQYEAFPRATDGDLDPRLPELLAALEEPELPAESGWSARRFALLHGDLSIGNILWGESSVGLIDWEFSRVGDPAEDLAYLLTEQAAGPDLAAAVRAAYGEAGGDAGVWQRVPAYGLFTAVDSALWWADYVARNAPPQGRQEIAARIEMGLRWHRGDLADSRGRPAG